LKSIALDRNLRSSPGIGVSIAALSLIANGILTRLGELTSGMINQTIESYRKSFHFGYVAEVVLQKHTLLF